MNDRWMDGRREVCRLSQLCTFHDNDDIYGYRAATFLNCNVHQVPNTSAGMAHFQSIFTSSLRSDTGTRFVILCPVST
jgi:hypothetical protein